MQLVVSLAVGLDVEKLAAPIPLALVQLDTRVDVEVDLERQRPLEQLVAHGALVFSCFGQSGVQLEQHTCGVGVRIVGRLLGRLRVGEEGHGRPLERVRGPLDRKIVIGSI